MDKKLVKFIFLVTIFVSIPKVLAPITPPPATPPWILGIIKNLFVLIFGVDPFTYVGTTIDFIVWYILVWLIIFTFIYNILDIAVMFKGKRAQVMAASITIIGVHMGVIKWISGALQGWILPTYMWGIVFTLLGAFIFFIGMHFKTWFLKLRFKEELLFTELGVETMRRVGKKQAGVK